MSPYFYLSHARAEDESSVQKFFNDLSDSIRIQAGLPSTEVVGRYNASPQQRDEGRRTSRVMIALLSQTYLRDEKALFDWKIFELRRRCALLASRLSNHETLKRSIIPISWSPYSGSIPLEIGQAPLFQRGANDGIQSLSKREYAAFVNSLAAYIIEVTNSFQLMPLESIPEEKLFPPFTFNDQLEAESPATNVEPAQNLFVIDGAFIKTLAEQIKETAGRLSPASISAFSTIRTYTTPTQTTKERYSVFAVVDKKFRNRLKAVGEYHYDDFDIEIFDKPIELLNEITSRLPDLFVVNLDLSGKDGSGQELVEQLTQKSRSAIIAIYGDDRANLPHASDFGGAVGFLRSDVITEKLLDRMTRWARVGRNRMWPSAPDHARKWRPVFLSYSSADQKGADHVCYQLEFDEIGVWYAAETMNPGKQIFKEVKAGLKKAQIFVALLSPHYVSSDYCDLELDDFYRNKRESDIVIPVLYKCTFEQLHDTMRSKFNPPQAITISADAPGLGYQRLFRIIKDRLG